MPQRRALFLDANRITAYSWQAGHLLSEGNFAGDVPGLQAFVDYLEEHHTSIFYLVADVAEEGYQIEDIPYVQGNDRKALIERRLGQYFYGTPLTAAISLGRDKTGRRDEKMLFAALTRPQYFEPWLAALRQAETQLAGVYSVPLVIGSLFKALERNTGRYLLLSLCHAGLRQSFFQDGQMRFSRLTPLATGSVDEYAVACAVESAKIYQYLVGQRQVERGTPLDTLILAHPGEAESFRVKCRNTDELRFEHVNLVEQASKAKLKTVVPSSRAELLLLHLLLQKPPPHQLAPASERKFYRLWQMRFGLNATASLILASCLLFAAKGFFQAYGLRQETAAIAEASTTTRQKYEAVLKTLPPMPVSADRLRAVVGSFDEIEKHSPPISATLRLISKALDSSPMVDIQRIDWLPTPNAMDTAASAGLAAPVTPSGGTVPPPSGSYFVVAELQAQLPVSVANDNRAILEAVDHFVTELRKNDRVSVNVLHMPFDLASGKTIKSSTQEGAAQVEAPKFSLRLVQAI